MILLFILLNERIEERKKGSHKEGISSESIESSVVNKSVKSNSEMATKTSDKKWTIKQTHMKTTYSLDRNDCTYEKKWCASIATESGKEQKSENKNNKQPKQKRNSRAGRYRRSCTYRLIWNFIRTLNLLLPLLFLSFFVEFICSACAWAIYFFLHSRQFHVVRTFFKCVFFCCIFFQS